MAREGLSLLAMPGVRREEAPEGSGLVCLTIEVEFLAHELGEPGVRREDLADSVAFLRRLPDEARGEVGQLRKDWLPFLEAKLARAQE